MHLISCADLVFDIGAKIPRKVPIDDGGRKSMQIKTDNDRAIYDHSSGILTFCLTQTKFNNTVGGCQTELIAKSRAKVFGFLHVWCYSEVLLVRNI